MIKRVTVIVPDHTIYVNDECLQFDFAAPENVRVIQWNENGDKHVEFDDDRPNDPVRDYDGVVKPFVDLFNAEKVRIEAATQEPLSVAEERRRQILAELIGLDSAYIRPARAITAGNATLDDEALLIKLDERAIELRVELASLAAGEE